MAAANTCIETESVGKVPLDRVIGTGRFAEALKRDWPGNVLRSKGFFWLASRPDAVGEWSQAGGIVRHGPSGIWWAAVPRGHFEPMETGKIFDRCLLTADEMDAGPEAWKTFDHPFPKWFAEQSED
jgi:G3E family GTPase